MSLKRVITIGVALVLVTGCKEEKTADKQPPAKIEKTTSTKKSSGPKTYFVCKLANDQLAYFSVMVPAPAGTSEAAMAKSFTREVESLDRVRYPLPEGMQASCESDTDVRKMAERALSVRDEAMKNGQAFRSVTSWKP